MESVSNNYKNMCKTNVPTGALGRIHIIEDNITITEASDLQSFSIEDDCYSNDRFIGSTVAKKITVNIFNDNNIYNLENKEISTQIGFNLNNTEELISYGNYIIEKPNTEEVQAKTTFTGYDYMIKFNKPYSDEDATYPMSLANYFTFLCNQVGVVVGNTNFINSSYQVKGNAFTNGEDCRTVLSAIAQISGGIAKIGRDNKCYIINLSTSTSLETINGNNYSEISPNNIFGPINKLIIRMNSGVDGEESVRSDQTSIQQHGETAVVISDNQILSSAAERELVIDNIFNSINGITYLPFKIEYYGYPYLDSTDKIKIVNVYGSSYDSYIFNHSIKYDGVITGEIETPAITKAQSMYENTNDLKFWKRKTELNVDKINGRISGVVRTTEELEEEVGNIVDTTGTAEGKNIHLEDSAEQPIISAVLNGETSQATRSGKNLFNLKTLYVSSSASENNMTYEVSNNNKITLTATGTAGAQYIANVISGLDASKNYTASFKAKKVVKGTDGNPRLYFRTYGSNDGTNYTSLSTLGSSNPTQGTEYSYHATVTGYSYYRFYIYNNSGATVTVGEQTEYYDIQFEEGTEVTEWEEYGVMPSPDYPSEIKNVETRNLLDYENPSSRSQYCETTIEDNTVTMEAISTTGAQTTRYDLSGFDVNKTYTAFCIGKKIVAGTDGSPNIRLAIYGSNDGTSYTNLGSHTISSPVVGQEYNLARSVTGYSYYRVYVYNNSSTPVTIGEKSEYKNIMLEEGSSQTDYVPYDNIAVKVEGKNRLNNIATTQTKNGIDFTRNEDGTIIANGTASATTFIDIISDNSLNIPTDRLILNGCPSNGSSSTYELRATYTDNVYTRDYGNGVNLTNGKILKNVLLRIESGTTVSNLTFKPMLSEEGGDYEPYKSQTAFFPLHGQKLMEGSYLADNGIHNKKAQITLNGTETIAYADYTRNRATISVANVKPWTDSSSIDTEIFCDKLKQDSNVNTFNKAHDFVIHRRTNGNSEVMIRLDSTITSEALFRQWLATNTPTIEYPLAEEEIIPYTTDQQEAWYNLLSLNTYKNVSNITSDAYAKIEYAKDNGLDIYETKDNAKRKYKVTEDKISQLIIDKNFIKTEVSNTKSSLENNYYTKDTADNAINGAIDGAKNDLNNIISQNKTEIEQTATQIAMRVSSIETNGVDKVTTSVGYTFDKEGLKINRTGAKTNSKLDEKGLSVKDSSNQDLFYAGYKEDGEYAGQTVVETSNLVVNNYLNVNGAGRFQPYVNPVLGGHGMGCFDIGGVQ